MVGSTTEWEIIEASSLWGRLGATPTRTVVIRRRKYKVRTLKIYYGAGVLSSPTVIKANQRDGSGGAGKSNILRFVSPYPAPLALGLTDPSDPLNFQPKTKRLRSSCPAWLRSGPS